MKEKIVNPICKQTLAFKKNEQKGEITSKILNRKKEAISTTKNWQKGKDQWKRRKKFNKIFLDCTNKI